MSKTIKESFAPKKSENVLTFSDAMTPLQTFLELGSTDGEVVKRSQIVH